MPASQDAPHLEAPTPEEARRLTTTLLSGVSRSFYLTLRVLPRCLREPVGLAYLLARAADTIADTAVIAPERRLEHLLLFRSLFTDGADPASISAIQRDLTDRQKHPAERELLLSADRCLALLEAQPEPDRRLIRELIPILATGMEKDLLRFSGADARRPRALVTAAELDEYTYLVAGCVGPFWTRIARAHLCALVNWDEERQCELGIRFGKALQLTNILRDLPRDLGMGRCYLPVAELQAEGLAPGDLLGPEAPAGARRIFDRWLDIALGHYEAAWQYTLSIPRGEFRLRLACIWPIWIGLDTLALLRAGSRFLDAGRVVKISRRRVYRLACESVLRSVSDRALTGAFNRLLHRARRPREPIAAS